MFVHNLIKQLIWNICNISVIHGMQIGSIINQIFQISGLFVDILRLQLLNERERECKREWAGVSLQENLSFSLKACVFR